MEFGNACDACLRTMAYRDTDEGEFGDYCSPTGWWPAGAITSSGRNNLFCVICGTKDSCMMAVHRGVRPAFPSVNAAKRAYVTDRITLSEFEAHLADLLRVESLLELG